MGTRFNFHCRGENTAVLSLLLLCSAACRVCCGVCAAAWCNGWRLGFRVGGAAVRVAPSSAGPLAAAEVCLPRVASLCVLSAWGACDRLGCSLWPFLRLTAYARGRRTAVKHFCLFRGWYPREFKSWLYRKDLQARRRCRLGCAATYPLTRGWIQVVPAGGGRRFRSRFCNRNGSAEAI